MPTEAFLVSGRLCPWWCSRLRVSLQCPACLSSSGGAAVLSHDEVSRPRCFSRPASQAGGPTWWSARSIT